MTKVRSPSDVNKHITNMAKEKGISLLDAIDIYTEERAQKGIAVIWESQSQLREQWVGKDMISAGVKNPSFFYRSLPFSLTPAGSTPHHGLTLRVQRIPLWPYPEWVAHTLTVYSRA